MTTLPETLHFPASHDTIMAGEQKRLGGSSFQTIKMKIFTVVFSLRLGKQCYRVAADIVNNPLLVCVNMYVCLLMISKVAFGSYLGMLTCTL